MAGLPRPSIQGARSDLWELDPILMRGVTDESGVPLSDVLIKPGDEILYEYDF